MNEPVDSSMGRIEGSTAKPISIASKPGGPLGGGKAILPTHIKPMKIVKKKF